eukprot:m.37106 g.37106  ORF g.37106 m.37106 type:complete len:217 (+) comp32328_c0_seq3:1566-2216(+)
MNATLLPILHWPVYCLHLLNRISLATEKNESQSQSCRGNWRHPHQGWGHPFGFFGGGRGGGFGCGRGPFGGWGFGGGPPRWARCLQRREERRQQRRQEKGETSKSAEDGEKHEDETQDGPEPREGPPPCAKGGKKCDKQRRRHLRKIGEAVATVLQPFGVHVDVDVLNDDELKQRQQREQSRQQEDEETRKSSGTDSDEEDDSQEDVDAAMVQDTN